MTDDVPFQTSTTTVIRGFEARTIAKREAEGWEFVSQKPGALRTELTFRRPQPKTPWRLVAAFGSGLAVLAIVVAVNSSLNGDEEVPPATSQSVQAAASSSPEDVDLELDETPQSQPASAQPEPEAVETVDETPLTMETHADLAALLTGPDQGPTVEQFAVEYANRIVEFDASVGAMAPHGDYSTRYDILISYGDYSETISSGGPAFQFRDVNTVSDLHYVGEVPDSIGVGDNLRVTARVLEFDAFRNLFQLEPIATRFR